MNVEPVTVVLSVAFPSSVHERLRAVSPRVRLVTAAELARAPRLLEGAEVALVPGGIAPARLAAARRLRWLQSFGAGVNGLLTPALVARTDLVLTNARGLHAEPIAEHVFGFILMFARNLHRAVARQAEGVWAGAELSHGLRPLSGVTLGILGAGAIGRRIAQIGRAFGQRVIGLKRHPTPLTELDEVYGPDELPRVLAASDCVVNVLPLTRATRGLLGAAAFASMRPGALFINVGRGATVDTDALVEALRAGHLGGAGLDVTDPEPLPPGHPLWHLPNVIVTPHHSGAHPDYDERLGALFAENLRRYVAGEPLVNVVDKEAGY